MGDIAATNPALNKSSSITTYFSPQHLQVPGAASQVSSSTPTLFTPLKIRNVTLRNRIVVAPMCQYSTAHDGPDIGALTDYHIATLGHYALKGAGAVFIEATGVQANGRISPNCPGLWSDAQIAGVKRVSDFVRSQGALSAIQLAHAGRKASTIAPWLAAQLHKPSARADVDVGGWPDNVVGPTGGDSWDGTTLEQDGGYYPPREMTKQDIADAVQAFADSAQRAIKAGVDIIEIHAAHGYLLCQFLSPVSNRRSDEYGGSFENRTRFLYEVIARVRAVIPKGTPLFLRVSATEWLEETEIGKSLGSWDVESTLRLAREVADLGIDLLDVSSGGNHPQQRINMFNSKDYQTKIAAQIRRELRSAGKTMLIGAVGLITEAEQARNIVQDDQQVLAAEAQAAVAVTNGQGGREPQADLVLVARQFMREPEWVLRVAAKLGIEVAWPSQFLRVRFANL